LGPILPAQPPARKLNLDGAGNSGMTVAGLGQERPIAQPQPASLLMLPWKGSPQGETPVARTAVDPQTPANPPMQPVSHLAPVRERVRLRRRAATPVLAIGKDFTTPAWAPVARFLERAPRDLRLLAMLAPLLILLALRPTFPHVTMAKSRPAVELSAAMAGQWRNVKHTISGRAGVDLADDFRAGLDNWSSREDPSAAWSYDAAGFVRPAQLALYQPSMNLTDYQVEMLAEIDKKALGVAVRSSSFDHYQAVKLAVNRTGLLPKVSILHYAVVGGKPGPRTEVELPFSAHNDALYHLRIEAHGEDFTVYVQEQLVTYWSDNRFRSGGVGLFCSKGEDARVRWIEVMHQYDALGRLCAYLAPYGMQTSKGSWTKQ
ncbi:MAG: hypothetical protein ABI165_16185, partial [Bryobacteraceae bacterium]